MRATISGITVEGTPEEIAALIRAHSSSDAEQAMTEESVFSKEIDDDERFASEKIAYRALRRRPLSSAQRIVFRTLMNAYPDWVSAADLQSATGYNGNQLGGLFGGIGRRLSSTEGHALGSAMFEWMWHPDEHQYVYRLPPSVYHAVKRIDP